MGVNSLACQRKGLKSDFFFLRVDGPIDGRAYNLLEFHIRAIYKRKNKTRRT